MFKNSEQTPTLMPPANTKSKNGASGKTTPMENISIAVIANKKAKNGAGAQQLSPSMPPPASTKSAEAAKAAATAWNDGATINALWSINQDKNAWIGDAALGWQKLSNASDSGIVALTMLCSHAKQMGSTVNYRTEDDGMVHEIYVW